MTTASTRRVVWNGLLDVSRQVRYYGELADRFSERNQRMLYGLISVGGLEAVLVVAEAADGILILVSLSVATIAAWAVAGDYAKKAAVLHGISLECSYLEIEWAGLWERIDGADYSDDSALARNQRLQERLNAATSRAFPVGIRLDAQLNKEVWAETCKVLEQQYA